MGDQRRPTIQRSIRRSVLAWMYLIRVHVRIGRTHHALLAEHGLTHSQFFVLSNLVNEPGMSQQALADRLDVTKGNTSGLIERMEEAGLVERRPDPEDRRSYQLYATEAGHRAFESAAPALENNVAQKLSVLTDEEQTTLVNLLAKVDRALRKG
jgi:MarR family transcriptional regulator, organic hydroperoxide resistance regulator